jgi:membrane protease YdiL (CAAX protease family)
VTLRGLFVSGDGRLRAPWRIAIFLATFVALSIPSALLFNGPLAFLGEWIELSSASNQFAVTLAVIGAHVVMLRWIDKRPSSYAWLNASAARQRVVATGFLLGALPIAAASLALLGIGWLSIGPAAPGPWAVVALRLSVFLAVAAFFEELFSRGYVFAALKDWMGAPAATGLTSVAFGLLHLANPGARAQPIVMVTLAGIFLAAVLLATQSLYAAWAAHFAWNWVMAVPLHVSVSGLAVPRPGYETVDSGPDWATGGPWGPEGGAFAAVAMVAVMVWMYARHKRASDVKLKTPNAV